MTLVTADMYLLILTLLLIVVTIYLFVSRRGARIQRDVALKEVALLRESKAEQERIMVEQQALAESAKEELRKTTIKLEAALSANQGFEKSRDQIWDMYRRSSIAAGNAQAWLSRELSAAIAEINKYRKQNGEQPRQVPPGLEDALADYRQEHVETPKKEAV